MGVTRKLALKSVKNHDGTLLVPDTTGFELTSKAEVTGIADCAIPAAL